MTSNQLFLAFRTGMGKFEFHAEKGPYKRVPPPYKLTVMKGHKNTIISKEFATFVTTHKVATDYYFWIQVRIQCVRR